MEENKVFIYALVDPRDGSVRYVGKTKSVKHRLKNHKNENGCLRKNRWIALLKSFGLVPEIIVLEEVFESVWQDKEKWWIKHHKDLGCDLTNLTSGGEGLSGISDETKELMSKRAKDRMATTEIREKIFTKERSLRISESLTGKTKSKEHIAKLRQNQPGWKHSSEAIEKIRKNNRGHRWGPRDLPDNTGNKYGIGNKSNTGRKLSEETKEKIGRFFKGIPKTKLQRQRMSQARKDWWKRRKENVLSNKGCKRPGKSTSN